MEFGDSDEVKHEKENTIQGDPALAGKIIAIPGMRIRLTKNIDKEGVIKFTSNRICFGATS